MAVRDISVAADQATRIPPQTQPTPKTGDSANKPAPGKPAPAGDVVDISTRPGGVVEKYGVADKAAQAAENEKHQDSEQNADSDNPENRQIRRDYSVDNQRLVVKVIDTNKNEVIKEIPPEEERRIRQAVSEMAAQEQNPETQVNAAGQIDVTS